MKAKILSGLLFAIVAFSFGYAGLAKILDPERFLSSLLTYELFPYKLAVVIALFVPWLELALAISLLTRRLRSGATWIVGAMLLVFIALIVQGRLRELAIDCGCYGTNVLKNDYQYAIKIGQDVLLLLALWIAVLADKLRLKSPKS